MKRETDELDQGEMHRAVWFGRGAAALGLAGDVRQADFAALLNGLIKVRG